MKGLELSRRYYGECGKPMLEREFPEIAEYLAAGLFGSGSECYGYDDELSEDHDFEPGFCLFLPGEDLVDEKTAFQLERAYNRLPKQFEGYSRKLLSPAGGKRHGVFRASEFFTERIGSPDGRLSAEQWLRTPDHVFSEMTNGEIFRDDHGLVTGIRERIAAMPEDIFFKRLAGALLIMNQAGQYNYLRCIGHGETAASQLALNEFVNASLKALFLLNRTYMPYYKWSFRALRSLEKASDCADLLEELLTGENSPEKAKERYALVETVVVLVLKELLEQGLTELPDTDFEKQAYALNRRIKDPEIRNLDILVTV